MTKAQDLTYYTDGYFAVFTPVSKAGEIAWSELAKQTDGTGKVFVQQLELALYEMRKAGYTVHKVAKPKKMTKAEMSTLFDELDELFGE